MYMLNKLNPVLYKTLTTLTSIPFLSKRLVFFADLLIAASENLSYQFP